MFRILHQADSSGSGSGVPTPPAWLTEGISEGRPPAPADLRDDVEASGASSGSGEYRLPPPPPPPAAPSPKEGLGDRASEFPGEDSFAAPPPPSEPPAFQAEDPEPPPPLPPPLPKENGPLRISIGSGVDSPDAPASGEDFALPFEDDLPPPPPPAEAGGISQERVTASDPKYRQMSLQELRAAQQKSAEDPEEEKTPSGKWESSGIFLTSSIDKEDEFSRDDEDPAEKNLAALAGIGREEAVDAFGVPKRLPQLPASLEDSGAPTRRIAGAAWIVLGLILLLTGYLAEAFHALTAVAVPMVVTGAMLTTGKPWSGILGILSSLLFGIGAAVLGALVLTGLPVLMELTGLNLGGVAIGLGIIAFGILLIVGNLVMLIGSPVITRAAASAVVLVFGLVALIGLADISEGRAMLQVPTGPTEEAPYGSARQGFTFVKPAGWAPYPWSDITSQTPMGAGLQREPEYYFLNRAQTVLVAFYTEAGQRPTLAQLIGRETPSALQEEIARGLPAGREAPDEFDFEGHHFTEMIYEGVLEGGESLAITVARTQLGQRSFYVAATRDARSRATTDDVEKALNAFYSRLELIPATEEE